MSDVQLTRLANGVTVVTHRMAHLESVAMGLWVGTGSRFEATSEHGISHLLEHMAFKGTDRRSARELAEAIEAVGGEMNAETGVDHTSYYLRLLKEDVALGMDVLGDIICNPKLDAEELSLEQHVILQELGAAHDMPEDWVYELFQEAAYPGQAIGRSVLGTADSIKAHTPADLLRFLRMHYTGPSLVVSAAGNLDHDTIVRLAEEHLAALPGKPAPAPEPGIYLGGEGTEARELKEVQVLLGFAAPSFRDPAFAPAHVFSSILGGGMASRLFQELREERGLCYSIYSFYWPYMDTGLFGIQAATSDEDVAELVDVTLDELARAVESVTDAEIQRAKTQLRAGLLMTLESPIARAGQMARHVLIHGRPLTMAEMVGRVEAVKRVDLSAFGASLLACPPTLAAIGPVDGVPRVGEIGARLGTRSAAE